MNSIHMFVPLSQIELYYCQGWFIASLLGPPHGFYAVLMELRLD